MKAVTVYHHPRCATSRNVLKILNENKIQTQVIEYLKQPPSVETLQEIVRKLAAPVRTIIRTKDPLYKAMGLDDMTLPDSFIYQALAKHPTLLNRPIVVDDTRALLCRPADRVMVFWER